jgi:hypothetical protein
MWTVLSTLVVVSISTVAAAVQTPTLAPVPVSQVTVTPGMAVLEFDLGSLKGARLRQMAWSPDGTQLYLQTYDANKDATVKELFHYVLPVAGGAPKRIDTPPAWAADYWAWKSGQTAPDDPTWKIDVSTEKKIASAVAMPMGGDLARGGTVDPTGGVSVETMTANAAQAANVSVYTMRLKGETVGEWTNHPIMPGLTFGWGPKGSGLMAYAEKAAGRLTLMDRSGKTARVDGTKDVVLPAFTADRNRLAYLEGRGRNKYALVIATVK